MKHIRVFSLAALVLASWPALAQAQRGQFTVQIESASTEATAESKAQQLRAGGLEAYWIKSDVAGVGLRYRVRVGRFPTRAAAKLYGERLRQQGVASDFFVAEYETPTVAAAPKKGATKPAQVTASPAPPPSPADAAKPERAEPSDNAAPKPPPAAKPRGGAPSASPLPPDRLRRPRDAVAAVVPTSASDKMPPPPASHEKNAADNRAALQPGKAVAAATAASAAPDFLHYQDAAFGYSFDYPRHWDGGRLSDDELQAQRIDAGVMFRSKQDAAFMNAIWNRLKGANSQSYDNSLIVDLVVKSLGSGAGFQGLTETARRVVVTSGQVNTFVDLRTLLSQPSAPAPLEFLGKAVIIRSQEGILLVVAFYSKNSPPGTVESAERIIKSARVPE